jgi:UPF0755 protein
MNRRKICLIIFVVFFVIVLIGSVGGFLFVKKQLAIPASDESEEVLFEVKKGEGVIEIAHNLKNKGLIEYPWLFVGYNSFKGMAKKLKAGKYLLKTDMTIPQISDLMFKGETGEWQVTFPEGFSFQQMARRLADKGIVNYEDFINEVKNGKFNYEFLSDKPESVSLEGYLFPDTYKFSLEATPHQIIDKMLSNFDQKLTSQMREDMKAKGMTIYQTVIFSSILEKEASEDEDRKIIADIFYKRLDSGQHLQSCATVEYILGENKERLSYQDTQVESSYNTYLHPGLPPGPICNPGLSALQAAIYPTITDYLYFLSTLDDQIIYSKTFQEHQQNQQKYLE